MPDTMRIDRRVPPHSLPETPLSVAFLVGDRQAQHCGVKDYTHRVADALIRRGIRAEVLAASSGSPRALRMLHQHLRSSRFDVVHIQYPSIGFRYSLLPHVLGWMKPAPVTCVTVHEYSRLPLPQRIAMHLFRSSAHAIFFSTPEEKGCFTGRLPSLGAPRKIIPIASNVPVAIARERNNSTVLYFGQIRPRKGVEAFLDAAALSFTRRSGFTFHVVGACLPRHLEYLQALQSRSTANVKWSCGESFENVAQLMATSMAAYLPFPDGATFTRGSLLAALANGMPVLSTISATTSENLRQRVLRSDDAEQALAHLQHLRDSPAWAAGLSSQNRLAARPFSWTAVVDSHLGAYRRLCANAGIWRSRVEQDAVLQSK